MNDSLTAKVELLEAIFAYGQAMEARGKAFPNPNVTPQEFTALCETTTTAYQRCVDLLSTFEARPF